MQPDVPEVILSQRLTEELRPACNNSQPFAAGSRFQLNKVCKEQIYHKGDIFNPNRITSLKDYISF